MSVLFLFYNRFFSRGRTSASILRRGSFLKTCLIFLIQFLIHYKLITRHLIVRKAKFFSQRAPKYVVLSATNCERV